MVIALCTKIFIKSYYHKNSFWKNSESASKKAKIYADLQYDETRLKKGIDKKS
jgi:hypothetical protein